MKSGYLSLPSSLLALLRAPHIRKVGCHIQADLTRLFKDCGFSSERDQAFAGALELGALAKSRNLVQRANTSLADMLAATRRLFLPKEESIRVSTAWDDINLPKTHLEYAALDAYATWLVFDAMITTASDEPVTMNTTPGTPIRLWSRNRSTIVARGFIALDRPKSFKGVNVTRNRAVVTITSVQVPGYLVRKDLLKSELNVSLGSIMSQSPCPFSLLCSIKDLQICHATEAETSVSAVTSESRNSALLPPSVTPPTALSADWDATVTAIPNTIDTLDGNEEEADDEQPEQNVAESIPDPTSMARAQALTVHVDSYQEPVRRSGVLGDIFHVEHQFKIPIHHGLRKPFLRALRDALLLPDPDDKAAVEAVVAKRDLTFDQVVLLSPKWTWKRVRRLAPAPHVMHARVSAVFQAYGPLKDCKTGQPVFNEAAWNLAENTLENIRNGYYSDPPGIQLYMVIGQDKDGLTKYTCLRGTNSVEGGIHQNIRFRFGSYNASPRFAVCLLGDYVLNHNLVVSQ